MYWCKARLLNLPRLFTNGKANIDLAEIQRGEASTEPTSCCRESRAACKSGCVFIKQWILLKPLNYSPAHSKSVKGRNNNVIFIMSKRAFSFSNILVLSPTLCRKPCFIKAFERCCLDDLAHKLENLYRTFWPTLFPAYRVSDVQRDKPNVTVSWSITVDGSREE